MLKVAGLERLRTTEAVSFGIKIATLVIIVQPPITMQHTRVCTHNGNRFSAVFPDLYGLYHVAQVFMELTSHQI